MRAGVALVLGSERLHPHLVRGRWLQPLQPVRHPRVPGVERDDLGAVALQEVEPVPGDHSVGTERSRPGDQG